MSLFRSEYIVNPQISGPTITGTVMGNPSFAGSIAAIGGVSTAGALGIAPIVASYNTAPAFGLFLTSGSVAIPVTSATLPVGTYRVTITSAVTTTFAGNSVSAIGLTLGWTDVDSTARTSTNALSALTSGGGFVSSSTIVTVGGANAITITPVATTGDPTSGVITLNVVVERLL
jgi:hypothetical protein